MRILIVDDEPIVLDALERLLRFFYDHDVFRATDYQQAVDIMKTEPLDLVMSDYAMPGPKGTEVLTMASQLQPQAVRVMLSGTPPQEIQSMIELGLVHQCFEKPFGPSLCDELKTLVAEKKMNPKNQQVR